MGYPAIAQHYWEAGWQGVLPLPPMRKVPPPSGFTGRGAPMPTAENIFEWINTNQPNANVGLRLPDGVIGIDVDTGYEKDGVPKVGAESWQHLIDTCGPIEPTWSSTSRLTGAGQGSGIRFYRTPLDLKWREKLAGKDIEIISHTHRFAVVWPSKHPDTGQTYRWIKPDGSIAENEFPAVDDLPVLPEKWVKALTEEVKIKSAYELPPAGPDDLDKLWKRVDRLAFHSEELTEGRNNELNYLAWRLGQLIPNGLVDELTVREKLWDAAQTCGLVAEDGERKTLASINTGLKAGIADPRRISKRQRRECTDAGNAQRFADREGGRTAYVHAWGKWVRYDGTVWKVGDTAGVTRAAIDTVRSITTELAGDSTDAEKAEIYKWYKISQSEQRIRSMMELGKSEYVIAKDFDEFDRHKDKFNCANGLIDLRTGTLSSHHSDDMCTKISPFAYDPNAQCPQFEQFLKRIFDGNDDMIAFIQRVIGYSLTGYTSENKLFVLWGGGANGKSTLIDIIIGIAGQYAKTGDPNMLLNSHNDRHTAELAVLQGARIVPCNETDYNRSLAEARVKNITGGDTISCRFMGGNPFDYKPQFKIWLASNYRPRVRGGDEGIWRRIVLIPFNVSIPATEREQGLADRLLYEEGAGILAWAVRGAIAWFENRNLDVPEIVTNATNDYRDSENTFKQFIETTFVVDPLSSVSAAEARSLYNDWCQLNGEIKPNMGIFKTQMENLGYRVKRIAKGNVYQGLRIRTGAD